MHKVHIQTNPDGQFYNVNAYVAWTGFKALGFEIGTFVDQEEIINLEPEEIIVGGVGNVRKRLQALGIELAKEELEYPEELKGYLGRKVWRSTLKEIARSEDNWNVFIKPVQTKVFNGRVVRKFRDLIGLDVESDLEVWCSEVLDLAAEWRCFIRYGQLLDVRRYKGNYEFPPKQEWIEKAIADFQSGPAAYSLDVGVDTSGHHYLVEVNDGHSLGTYGIGAISYAKFLSARWAEMTGTNDSLNF